MTFDTQTHAISTGASHAVMAAIWLNHSLLSGDGHVNENAAAARGSNPSASPESILVGKVAWAVVIPSDMTKQMADAPPEARYAFREWRREEVS